MPPKSSFSQPGIIVNLIGVSLIFAAALIQALGFLNPLDLRLLNSLQELGPSRFLPEPPRVILISLQKTTHGYPAMDLAMVLRGLKNLHPRCIVVNGQIEPEQGPVPFLPPIRSRIAETGITLVLPQLPSPTSRFQSIPLIRYSLTSVSYDWPIIDGKAIPGTGDAFFPSTTNSPGSDSRLALFANTCEGVPVGSLWWWTLPQEVRQTPSLLLFGKVLLLSNHTPLQLTSAGEANASYGSILEIPLDDFLLQCEQKEQGTISPTFDTLWDKSTVVIGSHDDASKAASLSVLLQSAVWQHLSLVMQGVLAIGWFVLLILSRKLSISPWIISTLILVFITSLTLLLLHQGIINPYLSGIVAALLVSLNKR